MHEFFAQVVSIVRSSWRYRWLALAAAWAVSITGWAVVTYIPDKYEASAQVHVDTDSVLRPLLSGLAVEPNTAQRVDVLTRTLLTRPNLEQVARSTDMHLRAFTERDMELIIDGLRRNLRVQSNDNRQNLYTIAYTSNNPRQSYEVVQALVNIFVESFLGGTRVDSDMAQRFLDQQIGEYEQRLQAAEQRLADFRRENSGLLPGEAGDYYQRLNRVREDLQQTELELREAMNRRDEVQRQLANLGLRPRGGSFSLTPALDARIEAAQERLDDLTVNFTERHPDIISLRRTLEDLERQREEEAALLQQGVRNDTHILEDNPVYQEMRILLTNAQVEVSALRVRADEHRSRIMELERVVDTIPQVEAELKRLDRDYEVNQRNFVELLQRRETAAISQTVEARGDQVQFRVVEPARVPLAPSAPNRPLLFAGVLVFAIGTGGGLAFLASQLRPVFDDRRALNSVTGFPVLGTVGLSRSAPRRFRDRVGTILFATGGIALMFAFVLVLMFGSQQPPWLAGVFR
jgi:polysaccharide chain length determinant protein (PEP-CTERM system associated)